MSLRTPLLIAMLAAGLAGGDPSAARAETPKGAVPPEPVFSLSGHTLEVCTVVVSPDGSRVASGSNREVKAWDAKSGKELWTYAIKGTNVYGLAFSPDGTRLAVGISKQVKLLDASTGAEVTSLPMSAHYVFRLTFSPDGKHLAAASGSSGNTGEGVVWEVASGKLLFTLAGHSHSVLNIAYSPDGQLLATAGGATTGVQPGVVKLWSAATGREVATLPGHPENIYGLAFSPDGRRLATGGGQARGSTKGGTVKVWEVVTGKEVAEFSGYDGPVFAVAYSPDGRRLATAGGDKVLRVRDPWTGQVLSDWPAHTATVFSLAFGPDGKRLVSAGQDKAVKVWDAPDQARPAPPADVPRTARAADALWADAEGADAVRAYRALGLLAAAPELAIPMLAGRLRPVPVPTDATRKRIESWVADLDHAEYRVRERAGRALGEAGVGAGPALHEGLTRSPSPEARERLEKLVRELDSRPASAEEIAASRGMEVLERIGTPEARAALKALAAGCPAARTTCEATASLARLAGPVAKPK